MLEEALDIATDPNYRFDLAVQLGSLEIAKVWCTYTVSIHHPRFFLSLEVHSNI